ncbi:MAG TPA: dihydrolipoamide acetyltransferase family protein [Pseudogracilibacillus sp.]|nr:dihydrolipoamide acetyltransferase family protein [Pseudogracilibacillus sp.]
MEVKFHDIGEGMTEGEILHYFVEVGQEVGIDEPLLEVQTDKMVAEIPSPTAGTVTEILVEPGTVVNVGETILIIDDGKESAAPAQTEKEEKHAAAGEAEESAQSEQKAKSPLPSRYRGVLAAPYTRKIARELGVNIENIEGTGKAGRVTEEDVRRYAKGETTPAPTASEQVAEQTEQVVTPTASAQQEVVPDVIPFKGIRKQIARNLTHSVQTIPHVTHFEEIDVTNLLEFRQELKEMGENVSVVVFFLKALTVALKDYPIFNAELDEEKDEIRLHKTYNIGLATDTENGLLVPVLHNVEAKSFTDIQAEMKELTEKAQQGKLSGTEMQGGTFTISNVGPLGGMAATPIINHPQTAIIAFHKTKRVPVFGENDEVIARSIMNISFSFDHRVADGADAVRFTNKFKELIEEPKKLFLQLK